MNRGQTLAAKTDLARLQPEIPGTGFAEIAPLGGQVAQGARSFQPAHGILRPSLERPKRYHPLPPSHAVTDDHCCAESIDPTRYDE